MPPRQAPTNIHEKKASVRLKRAIKRGDVEKPGIADQRRARAKRKSKSHFAGSIAGPELESSRRLQSSFGRLSKAVLLETKELAGNLPLPRPLPADAAVWTGADGSQGSLTCPRRPKWRYDMSKNAVEKNEEDVFRKWLAATDESVRNWQEERARTRLELPPNSPTTMPPTTTYFERNLEVWRQLWRVTEISQIILVLIDARCPLIHYPPSLIAYLASTSAKHILVLTKTDVSGEYRTRAWTSYLTERYPGIPIVPVESYSEQNGKAGIPHAMKARLVEALREAHTPQGEVSAPKTEIDWDSLLVADSFSADEKRDGFLTIGLIGQPNVGKSSLLNALFGASKVRASKTPGKTKHFQTLFWGTDIRLVDCPGLVFPNFMPLERQVLCGIIPISKISAVPLCIYFASQHLPLEQIFSLQHPDSHPPEEEKEDKRTWRKGMVRRAATTPTGSVVWTAMDVLTAYAAKKGWLTAQAGRPDVHRAGNAILRALAENRVPWAFVPTAVEGTGLWISELGIQEESDSDGREEPGDDITRSESDDGSSDGDGHAQLVNRFGALMEEGED